MARTTWSDVNGKYVDVNEKVQQVDPNTPIYGCDALWNTFWNLNQLWALVNPDLTSNWVSLFWKFIIQVDGCRKVLQVLNTPVSWKLRMKLHLIAGAYQKGIRDFDVANALKAMMHQQTTPGVVTPENGFAGNKFFESYMKLGYVPT